MSPGNGRDQFSLISCLRYRSDAYPALARCDSAADPPQLAVDAGRRSRPHGGCRRAVESAASHRARGGSRCTGHCFTAPRDSSVAVDGISGLRRCAHSIGIAQRGNTPAHCGGRLHSWRRGNCSHAEFARGPRQGATGAPVLRWLWCLPSSGSSGGVSADGRRRITNIPPPSKLPCPIGGPTMCPFAG